jgi:S-adenosylmethionine/arginine decarboxylase-like enzyme
MIEYLLPGDANQGFSLVQLITTSNICAHFVESNSTAYIDVFSCKPFDVNVAREVVKEFFNPDRIKMNFITRHAE